MDPYAREFIPREDVPMGEATVIENDDVIGPAATAEAIAQYDLSELSAKQIRKLSNYGAILDQLSPDQIAAVLEENEFSPDGNIARTDDGEIYEEGWRWRWRSMCWGSSGVFCRWGDSPARV